jgi:hypothetical protein
VEKSEGPMEGICGCVKEDAVAASWVVVATAVVIDSFDVIAMLGPVVVFVE